MVQSSSPPSVDLTLLSRREREVLTLVAQGLRRADAAAQLSISLKTVNNHLTSVFQKLGIHRLREIAGCLPFVAFSPVRAATPTPAHRAHDAR